jgi:hypothetical protein
MEINIKTEQDMKYKIKKSIINKKYFYFAISLQDSEQLLCNFNQMVPQLMDFIFAFSMLSRPADLGILANTGLFFHDMRLIYIFNFLSYHTMPIPSLIFVRPKIDSRVPGHATECLITKIK